MNGHSEIFAGGESGSRIFGQFQYYTVDVKVKVGEGVGKPKGGKLKKKKPKGGKPKVKKEVEVEVEVEVKKGTTVKKEVEVQQGPMYMVGSEGEISKIPAKDVKRSTYMPNETKNVASTLIQIRDNNSGEKLYLLGSKYDDRVGGDIQFGISETSHIKESKITNARRGVKEELQIELRCNLLGEKPSFDATFQKNKLLHNHSHWIAKISSDSDYSFPEKHEINPDPSQDNNSQKASVYLYGTEEILRKIVENFIPFEYVEDKTKRIHDAISSLAMIPFDDLESYL